MIRLEDTTGNLVQSAISAERHRLGATASGMVMTLLVVYRPRWVATFDDARYLRNK